MRLIQARCCDVLTGEDLDALAGDQSTRLPNGVAEQILDALGALTDRLDALGLTATTPER